MKKILVENIEDGMVLAREVCGSGGNVLLSKGIALSTALGHRLQNWGIPLVFVEGEEEQVVEENTVSVSPEELKSQLMEKFSRVINKPHMSKIFTAVHDFRLQKNNR
jgi:hypothetical protein